MSVQIEQAGRFLTLEFDGELSDMLIPVAIKGREAVSEIPRYTVDVVSDDKSLTAEKILGHAVAVIVTDGGVVRRFTGIVIRFAPGLPFGWGYRSYQLEVAPKLWIATLNARCRAFLSMSAVDIVQQVLAAYGIGISKRGLGGATRPARDYCLQYCESDFSFAARLLEEEGIFFYFPLDHRNDQLILVDGLNGSFFIDDHDIEFDPQDNNAVLSEISTVPQAVTFWGYDFKQASIVSQTTQAAKKLDYASGATVSHYTSNTMDTPRSQFFADMTMQRLEQDYEIYSGNCRHPKFAPGGEFKIGGAENLAVGQSVMVLTVDHAATCYTQVSGEGEAPEYHNEFTGCPINTNYRPPRRAAIPLIHGIQTAKVSSDPDQYGRIKVKFHWGDEIESWWTRIAMPWAHNQMGFQFFPRTGSEVVCEFLEGNPERPIIVGAVYNGVNKIVYTEPANVTQSGMRGTDPNKTGAPETLNELQFEDKNGEEFIKFFAEKDFHRIVVNNDTLEVREGDRTVEIKEGNLSTTLDMGNESRELKQGNMSIKMDLGSSTTEAMQSITLKVGESSIVLTQEGITIQAMTITIQGTMTVDMSAAMTTVDGDGMLTLTGGITMINS
ncbi:MAG TPA: type VI secretion system tip protein TssI/VgrG [Stellaceae bacterium]|jgi:type VI secretion system secreted protein VgrG|nr:type VI secretion system tip protein TssI/VgrG [Stellaceae bacterium]